jgi:hypothetical protein
MERFAAKYEVNPDQELPFSLNQGKIRQKNKQI